MIVDEDFKNPLTMQEFQTFTTESPGIVRKQISGGNFQIDGSGSCFLTRIIIYSYSCSHGMKHYEATGRRISLSPSTFGHANYLRSLFNIRIFDRGVWLPVQSNANLRCKV